MEEEQGGRNGQDLSRQKDEQKKRSKKKYER